MNRLPPGILDITCAYLTYVPVRNHGTLYLHTTMTTHSDAVVDPYYTCLWWRTAPASEAKLCVTLGCKAGFTAKGAVRVRISARDDVECKNLETDGIETFDLGDIASTESTAYQHDWELTVRCDKRTVVEISHLVTPIFSASMRAPDYYLT